MSQPNFVTGALRGLLKIIQDGTPENQPSEAVLKAYVSLLSHEEGGAPRSEFDRLKKEVETLRTGQAMSPGASPELNRLRRKNLQGRNIRVSGQR